MMVVLYFSCNSDVVVGGGRNHIYLLRHLVVSSLNIFYVKIIMPTLSLLVVLMLHALATLVNSSLKDAHLDYFFFYYCT